MGQSATYGTGTQYNRPAYHGQCYVFFQHSWLITLSCTVQCNWRRRAVHIASHTDDDIFQLSCADFGGVMLLQSVMLGLCSSDSVRPSVCHIYALCRKG